MSLVDKHTFESRGARGSSDSTYAFAMTVCCERVGVVDDELSDFYWVSETPSAAVSLLADEPCPFCAASRWSLRRLETLEHVPEHWRWACAGIVRPGSRRVRPLAEHLRELLVFCERVAGPLPAFERVMFLETGGPRVQSIDGAALMTLAEFVPRFDRLLIEGYPWINLSAYGIWQGALVVGVERPREAGGVQAGQTIVKYSGPPPGSDQTRSWMLERVVS